MSLHDSPAWTALAQHAEQLHQVRIADLFAADPQRFERFSLEAGPLLIDYSKHCCTGETLRLLVDLARQADIPAWIERMFTGEKINTTENRSVLHTALRNRSGGTVHVGGEDVMPAVRAVLGRMRTFSDQVRSSAWTGYSGKPMHDIVTIGIGGSNLGPLMVCEALQPYAAPQLRMHFVSNVDAAHICTTLAGCDPETTLVIVASKTFTTQETMTNARTARAWFLEQARDAAHIRRHFVAVSTATAEVERFGIDPANMFGFWDWVGGRYSVWSAIGLPVTIAVGMDRFEEFLAGAHEMDSHFRSAPLERNAPVLLGLLGVLYRNFMGRTTHAVLPYDQSLRRLPAYLQQLEMESNGKHVQRDGNEADCATCPIVWGEPGTDAQHSFFQLLHHGTTIVPADFLASVTSHHRTEEHHRLLLANFLAQTEALMNGKSAETVHEELHSRGMAPGDIERLAPHRVFAGNRPSTSIMFDILDPRTLGALIALYEHKVFVQGIIWNVNSFDQWGVELGKQLAARIADELSGEAPLDAHDPSTAGLIRHCRARCRPGT